MESSGRSKGFIAALEEEFMKEIRELAKELRRLRVGESGDRGGYPPAR